MKNKVKAGFINKGRVAKAKRNKIVSDRKLQPSEGDNKSKVGSLSESDTDVFSLYTPKKGLATQLKKYRNIKSKFIGASKITLLSKRTEEEENVDKVSVGCETFSVDEVDVSGSKHVESDHKHSQPERIVKRKLFPDEEPNLREAIHSKLKLKNKKLRLKASGGDRSHSSFSRNFLNVPPRSKSPSFHHEENEEIRRNSSPSKLSSRRKNFDRGCNSKSTHQRNGTGGASLNFQPTVMSTPFPKNPKNEKNSHYERLISRSRSERKHKHEAFNIEFPLIEHEKKFNKDDFWKSPEDVELDRSFQSFSAF